MQQSMNRIYLWDNVKALLIFLVVLGHFVSQYSDDDPLASILFTIIYAFHMPLFIFVSGLFSKSAYKDGKLDWSKVIFYLALYVALKVLIWLTGLPYGENRFDSIFVEDGIPWYMFAMAVFICITFLLRKIKPQVLIPSAFLISLIISYIPTLGDTLCLSRIFTFYPFFLLGYFSNSQKIAEFTRRKELRIISAVFLVGFIVLSVLLSDSFTELHHFFTARRSYDEMGYEEENSIFTGLFLKTLTYLINVTVSFAVICVLPNKKGPSIGANTLPIYFFHRPVIYILMDTGIGDKIVSYNIIFFLLLSIPLTLILSHPILRKPFAWLKHLINKEIPHESKN